MVSGLEISGATDRDGAARGLDPQGGRVAPLKGGGGVEGESGGGGRMEEEEGGGRGEVAQHQDVGEYGQVSDIQELRQLLNSTNDVDEKRKIRNAMRQVRRHGELDKGRSSVPSLTENSKEARATRSPVIVSRSTQVKARSITSSLGSPQRPLIPTRSGSVQEYSSAVSASEKRKQETHISVSDSNNEVFRGGNHVEIPQQQSSTDGHTQSSDDPMQLNQLRYTNSTDSTKRPPSPFQRASQNQADLFQRSSSPSSTRGVLPTDRGTPSPVQLGNSSPRTTTTVSPRTTRTASSYTGTISTASRSRDSPDGQLVSLLQSANVSDQRSASPLSYLTGKRSASPSSNVPARGLSSPFQALTSADRPLSSPVQSFSHPRVHSPLLSEGFPLDKARSDSPRQFPLRPQIRRPSSPFLSEGPRAATASLQSSNQRRETVGVSTVSAASPQQKAGRDSAFQPIIRKEEQRLFSLSVPAEATAFVLVAAKKADDFRSAPQSTAPEESGEEQTPPTVISQSQVVLSQSSAGRQLQSVVHNTPRAEDLPEVKNQNGHSVFSTDIYVSNVASESAQSSQPVKQALNAGENSSLCTQSDPDRSVEQIPVDDTTKLSASGIYTETKQPDQEVFDSTEQSPAQPDGELSEKSEDSSATQVTCGESFNWDLLNQVKARLHSRTESLSSEEKYQEAVRNRTSRSSSSSVPQDGNVVKATGVREEKKATATKEAEDIRVKEVESGLHLNSTSVRQERSGEPKYKEVRELLKDTALRPDVPVSKEASTEKNIEDKPLSDFDKLDKGLKPSVSKSLVSSLATKFSSEEGESESSDIKRSESFKVHKPDDNPEHAPRSLLPRRAESLNIHDAKQKPVVVKREPPSVKREPPSVKREPPSVKREPPSVKRESPSLEEKQSLKKDNTTEEKTLVTSPPDTNHTQESKPPERKDVRKAASRTAARDVAYTRNRRSSAPSSSVYMKKYWPSPGVPSQRGPGMAGKASAMEHAFSALLDDIETFSASEGTGSDLDFSDGDETHTAQAQPPFLGNDSSPNRNPARRTSDGFVTNLRRSSSWSSNKPNTTTSLYAVKEAAENKNKNSRVTVTVAASATEDSAREKGGIGHQEAGYIPATPTATRVAEEKSGGGVDRVDTGSAPDLVKEGSGIGMGAGDLDHHPSSSAQTAESQEAVFDAQCTSLTSALSSLVDDEAETDTHHHHHLSTLLEEDSPPPPPPLLTAPPPIPSPPPSGTGDLADVNYDDTDMTSSAFLVLKSPGSSPAESLAVKKEKSASTVERSVSFREDSQGGVIYRKVSKDEEQNRVVTIKSKVRRTPSDAKEELRDTIVETTFMAPDSSAAVQERDVIRSRRKITPRGSNYYERTTQYTRRVRDKEGTDFVEHDVCVESDNTSIGQGVSWGNKIVTKVRGDDDDGGDDDGDDDDGDVCVESDKTSMGQGVSWGNKIVTKVRGDDDDGDGDEDCDDGDVCVESDNTSIGQGVSWGNKIVTKVRGDDDDGGDDDDDDDDDDDGDASDEDGDGDGDDDGDDGDVCVESNNTSIGQGVSWENKIVTKVRGDDDDGGDDDGGDDDSDDDDDDDDDDDGDASDEDGDGDGDDDGDDGDVCVESNNTSIGQGVSWENKIVTKVRGDDDDGGDDDGGDDDSDDDDGDDDDDVCVESDNTSMGQGVSWGNK
ncbi:hypothetical protein ACOMHN_013404 [Nucella lapillus]